MTLRCYRICFAFRLVALFAAGDASLYASLAGSAAERGLPIVEVPRVERAFVDGPVEAFAMGEGGVVFVASHRLAAFDGAQWREIEVPETSRISSLAASADGRRIWVGAEGTLGYVERSARGEWEFVSLKTQFLAAGGRENALFRYVFPMPDGVLFVGVQAAFRWDGMHMVRWLLPSPLRLFGCTDGERALIYQPGVGILKMDVAGPQLWLSEKSMPAASSIRSMTFLRDGTLIAAFREGIFRWTDGHWFRLEDVSDFLKGERTRNAIALSDNTFAIATGDGLVIADADGTVRTVIGAEQGLAGGIVTGLWLDPTNQLWIGLNTGFARLAGDSHASLFDQRSRLFAQGNNKMRKVLSFDGRRHVVAVGNVFSLMPASETESARFSRTDFYWTNIRDATVFEDHLWLAEPTGLWRLPKGLGTRERMSTAFTYLLLAPQAIPDGFLCFERNACKAWLRDAGPSNPVDLKQPLDSVPVSAIEDGVGAVWLSTADGHVRKFVWDAAGRTLRLIFDFSPGHGLPNGVIGPTLTSVDGAVLAFTNAGILAFDPVANAFSPASGLDGLMGVAATTTGANGYWIVRAKKLGEVKAQALIKVTASGALGRSFTYESVLAPGLGQVGEVFGMSVTDNDGGEVLWLGGMEGVIRLETSSLRQATPPPELVWQRVQTDTEGLAMLTARSNAVFKGGLSRVAFSFGPRVAVATEGEFLYETRLESVEHEWSKPHSIGTREFTGLAPGRYTFAARAIDRFGRVGRPVEYMFVIEAPWYRQAWFQFVWLLPAAFMFWGMYRLRLAQQAAQMNLRMESQTIERKRIARELHDTLLQGFIGVGLKLEAIATNLPESLAPVRDQLRKILDQSDQYLTEARRSVVELRSVSLEKSDDLSHALAVASKRLMDGTEIELIYWVDGERRKLAAFIESNLLRIGEEAITNAVKHARATKVEVNLRFAGKEVCLRIRDNGCGFEPQNPEAAKAGHFGLVGIQERVKAISGSLLLSSQLGSGTEIIVAVPTT